MTETGTFIINGAERVIVSQWFVLQAYTTMYPWIPVVKKCMVLLLFQTVVPGLNLKQMLMMLFMLV